MATYYVDPENHTGTASDSVGGGTTTGNAYLNLSYALGDIITTHTKGTYGDTIKMIGTYAPDPTEYAATNSALPSYGSYLRLVSDGLTAFGTSSTSRAKISGANNTTRAIEATGIHYCWFSGFELENANGGHTMVVLGNYTNFVDLYVNQTDSGYSWIQGRVGFRVYNCYFKVTLTNAWNGNGGTTIGGYTYHIVNNCIFDLTGDGFTGLGLACSSANAANSFMNNTVYLKGNALGFALNASNVIVTNNLFVCDIFSSNSNGVSGWAAFSDARITGNHFENMQQAVGYPTTSSSPTIKSSRVIMTDNTYHNCTYVGVNDPSTNNQTQWALTNNNVNLGTSGVIDAANGDLRPSVARVGTSNLANMPVAGANWQLKTMAGNGVGGSTPTQYKPFG